MSYIITRTETYTDSDGRNMSRRLVWNGKAFEFGPVTKTYKSLAGAKKAAKRASVNPHAVQIEEL